MPRFTVIAGPNGAGKSTFSTRLSRPGAIIFDPDKEKSIIEKQFSDISDEALESALTDKYHKFELRALGGNKDFTVENNLRNEFLAERAELFKKANYQTRLIFMLLPDIASSMDRVNLRVKKKGHFVDVNTIKTNFEKSLVNLLKVCPRFDQVMVVCAASDYEFKLKPELLVIITDGEIVKKNLEIPDWALPIVDDVIISILGDNQPLDIFNTRLKR